MGEPIITSDPRVVSDAAALVDGAGFELISATGADRVAFLHRLVTGNVAGTPAGSGCRAVLLTLKGHIVSDMRIFVRDGDVRIVVAAGDGAALAAALSKYAIADDFVAAVAGELSSLAMFGPRAGDRLAAVGVGLPEQLRAGEPWSHAEVATPFGVLWLVRARGYGADGFWVWGDTAAVVSMRAALVAAGVACLAPDIAEAARIRAGEPRAGAEITADCFPMEVGLSDAIDYRKGCYLGQEPIVRIRDRGHVNWRLAGLRFDGAALPTAGDRLTCDLKEKTGRITSVGIFPGEGGVALALVHVSVPDGTDVRVVHGSGEIVARVVAAAA